MTLYGIAVRTPPPAPPPRDRPEPCTDPRGCQDPEYGCPNACGLALVRLRPIAQSTATRAQPYFDGQCLGNDDCFNVVEGCKGPCVSIEYARTRYRPAIVRPPRRFWTHLVQILRAFRRVTHRPRLLDPDRPRLLD